MMKVENDTIRFTLVHRNEECEVSVGRNQYYSLMTLISGHLVIAGFGQCCGMGSCGTCMVEISEKGSSIKIPALSCYTQIDDDLANTRITIPATMFKKNINANKIKI